MKRIFNLFLKDKGITKTNSLSDLTTEFNLWVGGKLEDGSRRFHFHAHANKFMIRKWCEKLNLQIQ